MILYAFYNLHDDEVLAVVSRKDVADKWHELSPSFNKVTEIQRGNKVRAVVEGRKVDDLMDVVNAFLRDVSLGGGE